MTAITFQAMWDKFHYVTKQPKLHKTISRKLWTSTIDPNIKRNAFYNIHKELKCSAYQYLLKELRNYK